MEKNCCSFLLILISVAFYSCQKQTIAVIDSPVKSTSTKNTREVDLEKKESTIKTINHPAKEEKASIDSLAYLRKKYAPLLNTDQDNIINLLLYKAIDDWMGVPYKYGGISKKGVDCSGFTAAVYNATYQIPLARRAADMYAMVNEKVQKSDLKEGDLVFFDIGRRELSHVGVYLTNGRFVHASTSRGVVISDLEMDYYKKYFRCGGRIIN